jgi:hypothetical protein
MLAHAPELFQGVKSLQDGKSSAMITPGAVSALRALDSRTDLLHNRPSFKFMSKAEELWNEAIGWLLFVIQQRICDRCRSLFTQPQVWSVRRLRAKPPMFERLFLPTRFQLWKDPFIPVEGIGLYPTSTAAGRRSGRCKSLSPRWSDAEPILKSRAALSRSRD